MVSIKSALCGDRIKKCDFCSKKELSDEFWAYWDLRLREWLENGEGRRPRDFKKVMFNELKSCGYCWEDIMLSDVPIRSGRLKKYVS